MLGLTGRRGLRKGVAEMLSAVAIALLGVSAICYVAMIVGAERSASHFSTGEIETKPRSESVPPLAPNGQRVAVPVVISTHPRYQTTRAAL